MFHTHLNGEKATTIVAVETTKRKRQQIEIVIGDCQKPFRVITIVPLQSLQRKTREKERCWHGVSILPDRNRNAFSPDYRIRRGLGPRTQTVYLHIYNFFSFLVIS